MIDVGTLRRIPAIRMPRLERNLLKPVQQRLIVIGDIILDKYVTGRSTRLSPEAPVPIISIDSAPEYRLGGAANVAANIKSRSEEHTSELQSQSNLACRLLLLNNS